MVKAPANGGMRMSMTKRRRTLARAGSSRPIGTSRAGVVIGGSGRATVMRSRENAAPCDEPPIPMPGPIPPCEVNARLTSRRDRPTESREKVREELDALTRARETVRGWKGTLEQPSVSRDDLERPAVVERHTEDPGVRSVEEAEAV